MTGPFADAEALPGLVALLGGRRNAVKLGGIITLCVAVTTFLTMMGAKQIWPSERMTAYETGLAHVNIRVDSTNLVMRLHQDTVADRRKDSDLKDRIFYSYMCDNLPYQRKHDYGLLEKCQQMSPGAP